LNTKLDARIRSALPINITTLAHLKTELMIEFKEALNFSKFHMDLVRARVSDYESLELFLDEMKKTFYRYKMARQYSNIDTPLDHKTLIENLVEQIASYTVKYSFSNFLNLINNLLILPYSIYNSLSVICRTNKFSCIFHYCCNNPYFNVKLNY
jgi:hypothetical protein